jgi:hypothetical protein
VDEAPFVPEHARIDHDVEDRAILAYHSCRVVCQRLAALTAGGGCRR